MNDLANSRLWTKEDVQELIRTSDRAVVNAIKGLFARQTTAEQEVGNTQVHNARGFNSVDAPFLSDIAKKLPRYNDHMTPRQIAKARPMLRKYWRQLLEMIEEKGGVTELSAKSRKNEIAEMMAPLDPVITGSRSSNPLNAGY